jgi:hypothetical protein
MGEFDDYGDFDPDGEFGDDFEEEPEDEEPEEGEGDGENEEEDNGVIFQARNVEKDPWKIVLGNCSLCGTQVTKGWIEQWGAVGVNGWEAFKACPNCQAGVFFQNGGHF